MSTRIPAEMEAELRELATEDAHITELIRALNHPLTAEKADELATASAVHAERCETVRRRWWPRSQHLAVVDGRALLWSPEGCLIRCIWTA
jgi:hypothetical protein